MAGKKGKNKYAAHSKISEAEFRTVAKMFAKDLAAVEIARKTCLNRNTVNRYTLALRRRIMEHYGEILLSEHSDKVYQVFGIRAGDRVLVEPVEGRCDADIRKMIAAGGGVRRDEEVRWWQQYDGIISTERSMRFYLNFGRMVRTSQTNSLMIAEDFFGYVKERMGKFFGVSKKHFLIHLKECEFRYNFQSEDLYGIILKMTKQYPLFEDSLTEFTK